MLSTTTTTAQEPVSTHQQPPMVREINVDIAGQAAESRRRLDAYNAAWSAADRAEHAFAQTLTDEQARQFWGAVEAHDAMTDAGQAMHLAELYRHFGGLAPAMFTVWEHILDSDLSSVGECCTPEDRA
jgi:hypothetical protein